MRSENTTAAILAATNPSLTLSEFLKTDAAQSLITGIQFDIEYADVDQLEDKVESSDDPEVLVETASYFRSASFQAQELIEKYLDATGARQALAGAAMALTAADTATVRAAFKSALDSAGLSEQKMPRDLRDTLIALGMPRKKWGRVLKTYRDANILDGSMLPAIRELGLSLSGIDTIPADLGKKGGAA
ncbi:MAG: hypothetical protein ABIQ51_07700 [Mesorhizobium sp.]